MLQSLLVGNGFDIQLGGQDFSNKWIIVRLLADVLSGETDELFASSPGGAPSVDGETVVAIINELPSLANMAVKGSYDDLQEVVLDKELSESLDSFKERYSEEVKSPDEIGIEDWFLLIRLFLCEQTDLLNYYPNIEQGFRDLLLNSIYCEGKIQQLWKGVNKKTINYLNSFDQFFTVNYDNSLEKLVSKPVWHLHGDYETKLDSENPQSARGLLRKQRGESVWFSEKFDHCNCNALLVFSGNRKYVTAAAFSALNHTFEELKSIYKKDSRLQFPDDFQEIIKIGNDKDLPFGYDYHFNDLKHLSGELTIIGLALRNDSHIIDCINSSNVSKVIFYEYKPEKLPKDFKIPFTKDYEIRDVSELWAQLGVYNSSYTSPSVAQLSSHYGQNKIKTEEFISMVNGLTGGVEVDYDSLISQLQSIPEETEKSVVKCLCTELIKREYHEKPLTKEELTTQFQKFSSFLSVSALSPQALLFLYFTHKELDSKKQA